MLGGIKIGSIETNGHKAYSHIAANKISYGVIRYARVKDAVFFPSKVLEAGYLLGRNCMYLFNNILLLPLSAP